jgi:hypothetical protein
MPTTSKVIRRIDRLSFPGVFPDISDNLCLNIHSLQTQISVAIENMLSCLEVWDTSNSLSQRLLLGVLGNKKNGLASMSAGHREAAGFMPKCLQRGYTFYTLI